jgi:catechol-2,3-dioxygenase
LSKWQKFAELAVRMTFFSLGSHHDFAVLEVGQDAPAPDSGAIGLAHLAFKIGDSHEEYFSAEADLKSAQITVLYAAERTFTKSLHLCDPDGNEVELYVETSGTWNISEAAASA